MKTDFVYYIAHGNHQRMTKEDICSYLLQYAKDYYLPKDICYMRRRLSYDMCRSFLYYFLRDNKPECMDDYLNLYDVY